VRAGATKLLLTSSGAVYGKQPAEMTQLPEDYPGAPDPLDPNSAYGEGKRLAELLCTLYHRQHGIETKIARCFTFVGPYLPLDTHFAIGNFIRDARAGGPIVVNGDGTPYRSYLYAADLAIWLWTILFRAPAGRPYNVGSDQAVRIAELATTIAGCFHPAPAVRITRTPIPDQPATRYIPSVRRGRAELGLEQTLDVRKSIQKTATLLTFDHNGI
jgi:nucleoside-diphosphate-sugar epimerase